METRRPTLTAEAQRLFAEADDKVIRVALPEGPGADIVFSALARDWGAIGFTVERAASEREADVRLVDAVAPSSSAAWFVRRFRCGAAAVCEPEADTLIDAARQAPVPLQRYALLQQAAAKIDDAHLFIAIAAPIRWSLVGKRLEGFAGNRFAIHTLTDLEQRAGAGD
jgi:peptide/nickel transport system substrate-binding protein